MSKILANQIANYGDDSPIEIKEGLNIPIGKPLQAAGVAGGDGQVLTSTGTSVEWTTPFDGDYDTLTNKPTIPAAQVRSDWNAIGTVAEIQNKPLVPPLPSVTVAAAGSPSLSYNSTTGLFTYTPPDLSGYATTASIANAANWDTAYSWGNHASASYLTAEIDTLDSVTSRSNDTQNSITVGGLTVSNDGSPNGSLNISDTGSYTQLTFYDSSGTSGASIQGVSSNLYINAGGHVRVAGQGTIFYGDGNIELNKTTPVNSTTTFYNGFTIAGGTVSGIDIEDLDNVDISGGLSDQQVLKWDSASSSWLPANDLVGGASGIALADLSVSTATAGSASLSYNNVNGVFTYTPPDLSGYLTSVAINDVSDVDINNLQDTQILRYNLTSGNWENWSPNYLTSYTETDPVFTASPANNITLTDINQWDTAYGWGNHANGGYLVATNTDKTNWNTAYGWGDHAQAGYLTAEVDTLATVTGRGSTSPEVLQVGGLSIGDDGGTKAKSLKLGDDADLTLYYDGRVGYVTSYIESDQMIIRPKTTPSDTYIDMLEGGPVRLYHGSSTRISTSATGAVVSGILTAGGLTYPNTNGTNGEVLTSDGTGNVVWAAGGSGGANVTISDTAPGSPTAGDLWWESDKGRLKIYYNDTDSQQWVDASPPLQAPNSPVIVGEVDLQNFGTEANWYGTPGATVTVKNGEGGANFTGTYYSLNYPTAFSSDDSYIVQATVVDPGTRGTSVVASISKHAVRLDFQFRDVINNSLPNQATLCVCIYMI